MSRTLGLLGEKTALRILAIESSGRLAEVALLENDSPIAESGLASPRCEAGMSEGQDSVERARTSSSQQLMPEIQRLIAGVGWKIGEIDLVCLSIGPGSFTGLRIGLVSAKSLCYVTGAKIVGVPTLSAIARQTKERMALGSGQTINAVLNAQRQQLFSAQFVVGSDEHLQGDGAVSIIDRADWCRQAEPCDVLTGRGLVQLGSMLAGSMVERTAPRDCWWPAASTIGKIGWELAELGRYDDLWTIQPRYCRPSYAEI